MLLAIPSVQNRAADFAADFASRKIGTRVSIDHITVGLLNKVRVRGFYVEDLDRDTLIYAGSVTAYVGSLSGITDRLVLNEGRVEDGKFILRETERGTMNVKEIVDRISRKRNGSVQDADTLARRREHRFPHGAARTPQSRVRCGLCRHAPARHNGAYRRLHYRGRSGRRRHSVDDLHRTLRIARVDDLSGSFLVNKGLIALAPLHVATGNSEIFMPELTLTGDGWGAYKDFIRNVRIDATVEKSRADTEDVGCFAPSIRAWNTSVSDATLSMHGHGRRFQGQDRQCAFGGRRHARAEATVRGLTDVPRTCFDIKVRRLDASTGEILRLLENIARLRIPQQAEKYAERTKRLAMSGAFRGTVKSFAANASVALGCGGRIELSGKMSPDGGGRVIAADVGGENVPLDRIIGQPPGSATRRSRRTSRRPWTAGCAVPRAEERSRDCG